MKTFKMMRSEYLCWLFNSRIILLPCVFIIVYTMITSDLVKCANNMGAPFCHISWIYTDCFFGSNSRFS